MTVIPSSAAPVVARSGGARDLTTALARDVAALTWDVLSETDRDQLRRLVFDRLAAGLPGVFSAPDLEVRITALAEGGSVRGHFNGLG